MCEAPPCGHNGRERRESNLTLEAAKRRSVFTGDPRSGRNAPNGKAAGLRGWAKVTTGQTQFYLFNWLIFQTASLSTEGRKILRNTWMTVGDGPAILYPLMRKSVILSAGQTGGLIVREITEITHFGSIFELDPFFGGVYELSGYR